MKKLLLLLLLVPFVSFGQTSQVSVYDSSGNNVGTYRVQSDYAERNSNNQRMAMQDYINYLESKDDKEAAAAERKELNRRAAKFGISAAPSYLGELGAAAVEGMVIAAEKNAYDKIENEKYAKKLGYSSYAELVYERDRERRKRRAAKKAARKARPSKKERKANNKANRQKDI